MNIQISHGIKIKSRSFAGGERHIQLECLPKSIPEKLTVKAYITNSDGLLDLLLLQNALDNHYTSSIKISLEIPYMPYARQDRVCASGQAFSMQVMARLLSTLHTDKISTWDCHSQVGLELTGAYNIEMATIIEDNIRLKTLLKQENSVVICPDKGAIKRCQKLVDYFNLKPMVLCEKIRDPKTGRITKTQVNAEDLSEQTAIITDDICDGGFTFIKIAEQLKNKNIARIVLYVTHGIFSKGLAVFNGLIDEIYTTNSFQHSPHEKLHVIEFNPKIGEES